MNFVGIKSSYKKINNNLGQGRPDPVGVLEDKDGGFFMYTGD